MEKLFPAVLASQAQRMVLQRVHTLLSEVCYIWVTTRLPGSQIPFSDLLHLARTMWKMQASLLESNENTDPRTVHQLLSSAAGIHVAVHQQIDITARMLTGFLGHASTLARCVGAQEDTLKTLNSLHQSTLDVISEWEEDKIYLLSKTRDLWPPLGTSHPTDDLEREMEHDDAKYQHLAGQKLIAMVVELHPTSRFSATTTESD